MNTNEAALPIGVFDSGIGGISVLADLVRTLPGEKYIYMADSANAPYGVKNCECVREISMKVAKTLFDQGIKALVVACNTATSVSIAEIRELMPIPVIGMEPALKPAVEMAGHGRILVMATPLTLQEEKFNSLYQRYNRNAVITKLPCPGLVELIEAEATSQEIEAYLRRLFGDVEGKDASTVVLGCTHYCFVKNEISRVLGTGVKIVDGNMGTARQLANILRDSCGLNTHKPEDNSINIEFLTSGDPTQIIPACQRFFQRALNSR